MPLINIKVIKGSLSEEKKNEMIARVSEVVAEIETRPHPKENILPYTWCLIEEVDSGHWGAGGAPVSLEMLQTLISGQG